MTAVCMHYVAGEAGAADLRRRLGHGVALTYPPAVAPPARALSASGRKVDGAANPANSRINAYPTQRAKGVFRIAIYPLPH